MKSRPLGLTDPKVVQPAGFRDRSGGGIGDDRVASQMGFGRGQR